MQLQQQWTIHMTMGKKSPKKEKTMKKLKRKLRKKIGVDERKASQFVCLEDQTVKEVMVMILLYVTGKKQMYSVPLSNFSSIPIQQSSHGEMQLEVDEKVYSKFENILQEERIHSTDFINEESGVNESMDFEEILRE